MDVEENEQQARRHDVQVEILDDEDVSIGRMHVRSSISALQRELENLPNMHGRPTIVVNHIYNIHHPTDRPSEQYMQDVEAHGRDYMGFINRRCLSISDEQKRMSSGRPECVNFSATPCLKVVGYFEGRTGLPKNSKYIPDTKYRKCACREEMCYNAGEQIELKQLHASNFTQVHASNSTEGYHHVAVVGNLGSGKTFICKKYANMVLDREVPQLDTVEVVHYISADDIMNVSPDNLPVRKLLFDSFIHEFVDENTRKYGYEFLCRNPEKMLFIFDGAEELLSGFTDRVEQISCDDSETNLKVLLQNILRGTIFRGCKTLVAVREWALRAVNSDFRPQQIILIGPMTVEQRLCLIDSLEVPKDIAAELRSALLQKFHASFHMTKDPAYLQFAVSCLMSRREQDAFEDATDVMLVLEMLQCLIRSRNCVLEFLEFMAKFKKLAFCMIKDGYVRVSKRCLEVYCKLVEGIREVKDFMVVAPQHRQAVIHRLLDSDFCYFFPNQVFQEVLASFHAHDLSEKEFANFADIDLHTEKWFAVRRFLCGIVLNQDIYCHLSNICHKDSRHHHQRKLLSSLESQVKKIDNLPSQEKLELLMTLNECGKSIIPILEKYLQNLALPDIAIEPSDLYALTRLGKHIKSIRKVSICFNVNISAKEYSDFLMVFVKKGEDIELNLSRLNLEAAHITALEAPFESMLSTRQQPKHNICITVKKGLPPFLIGKFEGITRQFPQLCTIKVKEVSSMENDI